MKSPCPTRMTLEDLTKSAVHLILGVREGHGFGFLNCPLVVVAGLDGHRLETDIIPPSGDPIFAIELVWEADIKNIRRLRQANTPVKIECYSVVNSQKRDRIGYILLSLKQAQIVPQGKKVNIIESWHRLLGVRSEMKTLNPEMLLTLRIEDGTEAPSEADSGMNQAINEKVSSNLLKPLLYADEGVIQIGSYEYCSDIFKLKMSIGFSRILKNLLPDVKKYGKQSQLSDIFENFTLCYTLLGYSMQTQIKLNELKEKDGRSGLDFDESAVIVVRSNLKMLKAYFNEYPTILFRLVVDNTELATTSFSLKGLVLADDVLQFKDEKGGYVESRCFLQPTNRNEVSSIKPYIDVAVKLSYEMSSPGGGYGDTKKSGIVKPVTKCAGHGDNSALDKVAVVETILSPRQRSLQIKNPECLQSVLSVEVDKVAASSNTLNPDCAESKDDVNQKGSYTYRCNRDSSIPHGFTLYLVLKSITFRKLPPVGKFTFRMHHPLAEVVCALHGEIHAEKANEKICLPPIEAEFRFTANSDEINNILMTEQPTITVSDVNNKVFCRAVVQTGMLLSTHKNKECAYTASLEGESMSSRTSKKQLGLLHITMSLKDCGILIKPACNSVVSTVSGVNTRVAYRVVEELEDWKERQQQIFKSELKRKECQHLTMLSSEWTKRRMELEDNLNRNVEQCRSLAHSLNEATDNMRERSRKNSEKERSLILAEKELDRKFELKFQELKEATQRMEADVNHKMSLMKYEKAELLLKIEQMEHEKKHLLQNIQSLEMNLDDMRSGGLTKEQAAGLIQEMKSLEEKLEAAHESKLFFKEQWGKAVREIHRLKKEHQHAVQAQLQKEKEDLHKFQIIQQAKEEERQMVRDKSILKNMKIETQDLSNVLLNQQPLSQQNTNGPQFMTPCLDLNNVQLQRLIDQRDQLLNSGAATNREMLAALNNQIRTLLLQMSN